MGCPPIYYIYKSEAGGGQTAGKRRAAHTIGINTSSPLGGSRGELCERRRHLTRGATMIEGSVSTVGSGGQAAGSANDMYMIRFR